MLQLLNRFSPRRSVPNLEGPVRSIRLAKALRHSRHVLAVELAKTLQHWEKYTPTFQKDEFDIDTFAKQEHYVFIDYLDRYFSTGNETYKTLYIGEKLKELYLPEQPVAKERENNLRVTDENIAVLCAWARRETSKEDAGLLETFLRDAQRVITERNCKTLSVLLIGDCFYLDIRTFLTPLILEDGVTLQPTFVTSKSPVEQRNELRRISKDHFDLIFYSPFTYAFSLELDALSRLRHSLDRADSIKRSIEPALDEVEQTVDLLTELFDVPTYIHNTANLRRHDGTMSGLARTVLSGRTRRLARSEVNSRVANVVAARRTAEANVILFDEMELLQRNSELALSRTLHSAFLQHPAEFGRVVAQRYREIIAVHTCLLGKKVVVVDLDNTLWRGEIGEGKVVHFVEIQHTLKELRRKGIVLAVNSKNDPKNVSWEGAVLQPDDFVHMEINWDSKAANLLRIQQTLNLKIKDFVFIDDRADQRLLVEEALPEIHVLDATSERTWTQLSLWASALPNHPEVDRTQQYRERDRRDTFLAANMEEDPSAAFARLDIRVEIRKAKSNELKRVTELINRTNQFNLVGTRTNLKEVRGWHRDPTRCVVVAEASDRFGPMGIICAALLTSSKQEVCIHAFVLSCRVFGYGIENAVVNAIKRIAGSGESNSVRAVRAEYKETPHNEPCRRLYPENGFAWRDGSWLTHPAGPVVDASWLTVTNRLSEHSTLVSAS
jgi:FkbH-like protein